MIKKAIIGLFAVAGLLNLSGFSYRNLGWMSDAEYLEIAADDVAGERPGGAVFADGAEFVSRNPGCCEVNRFGDGASGPLWKLVGWYVVSVRLVYWSGKSNNYPYDVKLYAIGNDGKILNYAGTDASSMASGKYQSLEFLD